MTLLTSSLDALLDQTHVRNLRCKCVEYTLTLLESVNVAEQETPLFTDIGDEEIKR